MPEVKQLAKDVVKKGTREYVMPVLSLAREFVTPLSE